jgi:hypothetical protein
MTAYVLKRKRPPVLQYTNDYTKTGSFAKIDKGVASGFSASNYLTLPETFAPTSGQTWEIGLCFITGNDISSEQVMLGNTSGYNGLGGINIRVYSGYTRVLLTNKNSDWVISKTSGTIALTSNTKYWIKVKFTGSTYEWYLSTNGIDYVLDNTVTSSTTVAGYTKIIGSAYHGTDGNYSKFRFHGSVDLSQSYININGSRWWSGDSYTKVGSWIDDNVVSGFSTSNYLKLPETVPLATANTWEKVVKFTYQPSSAKQAFMSSNNSGTKESTLGVGTSGLVEFREGLDNSSFLFDMSGSTVLTAGNTYWVKGEFTGSEYNLYLSTNGVDYTLEGSRSKNTKVVSRVNYIGTTTIKGYEYVASSSIDLTESYIKVDGEYWWQGAELITPVKNYVIRKKQYWKKVVTEITKYWKETTTETKELAYACYVSSVNTYFYLKTPLGSDATQYWYNNGKPTTSPTNLVPFTDFGNATSITEDSYKVGGMVVPRYRDGDIYETVTTTTVVEGTPDDYTYTEVETIESTVQSTKDDYDFITDKAYVLRRK